MSFTTVYSEILSQIDQINPKTYRRTRNYTNGAATRLSPYLTHGVISTKMVADRVCSNYNQRSSHKLIQELAWREFFQSVYATKQHKIWSDLRYPQSDVVHQGIPKKLIEADITITEIDQSIKDLISNGYIHNHRRMWLAALITNHAHYHWKAPSQWLYYHLLDGDLASNTLSWQWVAGTFSSKKYYANQDNINKFSTTNQKETYLDTSYEQLPSVDISQEWNQSLDVEILETDLNHFPRLDKAINDYLVYHPWMLDPEWRKDEDKKRILLLEEDHFKKHPISPSRVTFIEELSRNIPNLEIYTVQSINDVQGEGIITREHPAIANWQFNKDQQDLIFPELYGTYYKNFFSFWKQAEKLLPQASESITDA